MAYEGPIWYVDKATGFNSTDNGSDTLPLETIVYAISRIATVGFGTTGHTIRVKRNGATSYGSADVTSLTPTLTNNFVLTAWDAENNGVPVIDNVKIVNNMTVEGLRFESNAIYNYQVEISRDSLATIENILIRTNVFNTTIDEFTSMVIGGNSVEVIDVDNLNIIQNTFVNNPNESISAITFVNNDTGNGITNSNIVNNIFHGYNNAVYSQYDITGMINSDLTITNNCFYDVNNPTTNVPAAVNSVVLDPDFVNYGSYDYHLNTTSPCRDTGTDIQTTNIDIDGLLRPIFKTWDIGAYECAGTYLSQIIGGNDFAKGSGVTKTSVISAVNLLALPIVSGDTNFDSEDKWSKVLSVYKHADGQNKKVSHVLLSGTWQGQVAFSGDANTGTWEKREVILIDNDGDGLAIDRDTIANLEDLIIS